MNPMTNMRNVKKLSEQALAGGWNPTTSWHNQYKNSAWIFIGGLPYDLTEGDVLTVFSQYGEIVNVNLVRDKKTGKAKGFAFICYEDQRSTILAVDNFNGITLLGRILRVDHCDNYKAPEDKEGDDEATLLLREHGCAPGVDLPVKQTDDDHDLLPLDKADMLPAHSKKKKKEKKAKKKKKKKAASDAESDDESRQERKSESSTMRSHRTQEHDVRHERGDDRRQAREEPRHDESRRHHMTERRRDRRSRSRERYSRQADRLTGSSGVNHRSRDRYRSRSRSPR